MVHLFLCCAEVSTDQVCLNGTEFCSETPQQLQLSGGKTSIPLLPSNTLAVLRLQIIGSGKADSLNQKKDGRTLKCRNNYETILFAASFVKVYQVEEEKLVNLK